MVNDEARRHGLRREDREKGEQTSRSILRAEKGDRLIVRGHRQGEPDRDGEITQVAGAAGSPPFTVRWDDGHVSRFYPGSDAYVQHFPHPASK